jgi:hypothetical protein
MLKHHWIIDQTFNKLLLIKDLSIFWNEDNNVRKSLKFKIFYFFEFENTST